jgi:hypothetical protein
VPFPFPKQELKNHQRKERKMSNIQDRMEMPRMCPLCHTEEPHNFHECIMALAGENRALKKEKKGLEEQLARACDRAVAATRLFFDN